MYQTLKTFQIGHLRRYLEVHSFSGFECGAIFITTGVIGICGSPMIDQI